MRLFQKIYCTTVLIAALACGAGSTWLIETQFRQGLAQEVTAAYAQCGMLAYVLTDQPAFQPGELTLEGLAARAPSADIRLMGEPVRFGIYDGGGRLLCAVGGLTGSDTLAREVTPGMRGYEICSREGKYYICAALSMEGLEQPAVLESFRDITPLFTQRQALCQKAAGLQLLLLAAMAVTAMAVSLRITRPLCRLSSATGQVADGRLDLRLPVGADEVGRLAEDFNRMTARLEQQVEALRRTADEKQNFIDSFAHELKTPLTAIAGYADLLRSTRMSPERALGFADQIWKSARRLETLSRKMTALTLLGQRTPERQWVPVQRLFDGAAGEMAPLFGKTVFRSEAQPALLFIDIDLLHTACVNLMDNARRAAPAGTVALTGRWEGTGYCIEVADDGCGIPREALSRLTEAFFRVDPARSRKDGGVGLGLTICARVAELHGGSLTFESRPGAGTRAMIRLTEVRPYEG